MPRPLRIYLTWLVVTALAALLATSQLFDLKDAIALTGASHPTELERWAGVAFWIVVTLLASALL